MRLGNIFLYREWLIPDSNETKLCHFFKMIIGLQRVCRAQCTLGNASGALQGKYLNKSKTRVFLIGQFAAFFFDCLIISWVAYQPVIIAMGTPAGE